MRFNNKNQNIPLDQEITINTNNAIQFPSNATSKSDSAWFYGPNIKNTDTIEVKFVIDSWHRWCQMLGCNVNNSSAEFQFSIYPSDNGRYFGENCWNYGTGRLSIDYMFEVSANTEHILRIHVGTGDIQLDGGSIISGTGNNVDGTSYEALQFGCAPAGRRDPGFPGKIYYLKIYDGNNNLTFNAQATNNDNIPGFIDKVSGNRCTKGGNGTVTYV